MSIETTLFSALSSDATIRSYVSSGSPLVHRIFASVTDENAALPYIVYQPISHTAYNNIGSTPSRYRKRIQIDCISEDFDEAQAIAEAVKSVLESIGYQSSGGDDYFKDSKLHRSRVDFAFIS